MNNSQNLTPDNFDDSFDELIEKGYIEIVSVDKKGDAKYKISEKTESARRNRGSQKNLGTIDCPHAFKTTLKSANIFWEDSRVNVYGGVCDSPDLCKKDFCQYYDESEDGAKKFGEGLAYSHTLEGLLDRMVTEKN